MIREMKESDLAEVTEIEKQQFPESPWPESAFIYEMKGNPFAFLYCYEKDGKVAGYADLWITYDQAQIADIAVRPEYTGMGIGSELMDHCIREAVRNGCEVLTLEVRVSNVPALGLYEKYGFIRAAVRQGYYDNGEDAWLMVKPVGGLEYDNDTGD